MTSFWIAYALTGLACVIWDHRKSFHDRPAYARRIERLPIGGLLMLIGWLPLKFYEALVARSWSSFLKPLATFLILAIGSIWL